MSPSRFSVDITIDVLIYYVTSVIDIHGHVNPIWTTYIFRHTETHLCQIYILKYDIQAYQLDFLSALGAVD